MHWAGSINAGVSFCIAVLIQVLGTYYVDVVNQMNNTFIWAGITAVVGVHSLRVMLSDINQHPYRNSHRLRYKNY